MIEEIFDDQEIESAQENLPPSEKAFKFMSELNKFKGPTGIVYKSEMIYKNSLGFSKYRFPFQIIWVPSE